MYLKFPDPLLWAGPHAGPSGDPGGAHLLGCCICGTPDKNTAAHAKLAKYSRVLRGSWGFIFHFLRTPVSPHLVDTGPDTWGHVFEKCVDHMHT